MTYRPKTLIFAYGTLRPGCGNDRMLGDYLHLGDTTTPGRLYLHSCGAFPVFVPDADADTTVTGSLMLADDTEAMRVTQMEVNAGYNAEWIDLTFEGMTVEAITYPWRRPTSNFTLIPSGDWYDIAWNRVNPRHAQAWGDRDGWAEDVCDEPEYSNRLDDAAWYDGYCGEHADTYEKEGGWG